MEEHNKVSLFPDSIGLLTLGVVRKSNCVLHTNSILKHKFSKFPGSIGMLTLGFVLEVAV